MIVRAITGALVLVIGGVVGTVGTIAHQVALTVFEVRLPTGIVFAALAVACLIVGLRLVDDSRLYALLAAFGVLAPVALFSMAGAGGSVIIPENATGIAWTIAAAAICAIAVAWPRVHTAPRNGSEQS